MKHLFLILFTFLGFTTFSQKSYNTGDAQLDSDMSTINIEAKADLSAFRTNFIKEHNFDGKLFDEMAKIMEPAEIWIAQRIAKIVGISTERVFENYKVNKDKGWGYIAKQMGIKPGSPEFHELKGKSKNSNAGGNGNGNGNGNGKGKGKSKK